MYIKIIATGIFCNSFYQNLKNIEDMPIKECLNNNLFIIKKQEISGFLTETLDIKIFYKNKKEDQYVDCKINYLNLSIEKESMLFYDKNEMIKTTKEYFENVVYEKELEFNDKDFTINDLIFEFRELEKGTFIIGAIKYQENRIIINNDISKFKKQSVYNDIYITDMIGCKSIYILNSNYDSVDYNYIENKDKVIMSNEFEIEWNLNYETLIELIKNGYKNNVLRVIEKIYNSKIDDIKISIPYINEGDFFSIDNINVKYFIKEINSIIPNNIEDFLFRIIINVNLLNVSEISVNQIVLNTNILASLYDNIKLKAYEFNLEDDNNYIEIPYINKERGLVEFKLKGDISE